MIGRRRRRETPELAPSELTVPRQPSPPRRPLPPPGKLRRERRILVRAREDRIRDLGGLVLEMYRRDSFRDDLVYERCAELLGLEERLRELDALLAVAERSRHPAPAAHCECGAPIFWGSRFCPSCGRTLTETAEVACAHCGAPAAAGTRFCAACGAPLDANLEAPRPPELAGPEPSP